MQYATRYLFQIRLHSPGKMSLLVLKCSGRFLNKIPDWFLVLETFLSAKLSWMQWQVTYLSKIMIWDSGTSPNRQQVASGMFPDMRMRSSEADVVAVKDDLK